MDDVVVIIPALDPDETLLSIIQQIKDQGLTRIVLVDDGSRPACQDIFDRARDLGCLVCIHAQTRGKGAALKTGMAAAVETYGSGCGFVTADCDGQHAPEDIVKVAQALAEHPDSLILGVRDLKAGNIPLRSRLGNQITRVFFRLTTGVACPDTQTGLRGIPACLEELALTEEGDRFEYEMNFLTDAVRLVSIVTVPIRVIYQEGNRDSHFRPVSDSIRVYGRFLRFVSTSVISWSIDYLLFFILSQVLGLPQTIRVFLAVVLARLVSGTFNFTVNKFWSFRSRSPVGRELIRYLILFVSIMIASATLTSLLSYLIPEMLAKLLVDICLFFVNYVMQENWVFRKDVSA